MDSYSALVVSGEPCSEMDSTNFSPPVVSWKPSASSAITVTACSTPGSTTPLRPNTWDIMTLISPAVPLLVTTSGLCTGSSPTSAMPSRTCRLKVPSELRV